MEGVQPKNASLQVNVLAAPDQKKKKKACYSKDISL